MSYIDILPIELSDLLAHYFKTWQLLLYVVNSNILKTTIHKKDSFWKIKLKNDMGISDFPDEFKTAENAYKLITYYQYFICWDPITWTSKPDPCDGRPSWYNMEHYVSHFARDHCCPELVDFSVAMEFTSFIINGTIKENIIHLYKNHSQYRDKIILHTLLFGPKELMSIFPENVSISGLADVLTNSGYYNLPHSTKLDEVARLF